MDPRYTFRKGYDTDLVILRSLFALDPLTNLPISSFASPVANGIGGIQWLNPNQYFSSLTGIENFLSSIQSFSTVAGLTSNFSTQSFSNFITSSIQTYFISTKSLQLSSLAFLDEKGNSTQYFTLSNSVLYLNKNVYNPPSSVLTNQLVSSVIGLGTAKYISSSQLTSTIAGLGSNGLGLVNRPELVSTVIGLQLNSTTAGVYDFVNTSLISSVKGLGTIGYVSSSQLLSTVEGLGTAGYISSSQLLSTVQGLGTAGYVSEATLYNEIYRTVQNLGTDGYVSTSFLNKKITETVGGLGTTGYISSTQLLSTVEGLGTVGYVSSSQLVSTVIGLGTAGYISSSQLLSTVAGLGGAGLVSTGQFQSSLAGLGTLGYISSSQLISTVAGLGAAGYISSSQLISTVAGLGNAGYISSAQLISTVAGLGNAGYISSAQLASTVAGLGNAGYISSSQLLSTVAGLGGAGLVSSGQLVSSLRGLGTLGYISSSQLQSTIVGIGGVNLVSSGQLVSTTIGLNNLIVPASGVNTSQLTSTVIGLEDNFYVVNANNVFVNSSRVSISSVGTFIYFSTFMNSSITYQGNNGNITASNAAGATAPFYFSSAILNLDRWSSFINAASIITIETFPTFLFANNALPAANPTFIYISTFIQAGNNFTSSQIAQAAFYPDQYTANRSNIFNQPMKLTVTGATVQGFYPNAMRLAHYLPNALSVGVTQGLSNSNVTIFYGSTNSLFLSIQNLPL